MSGQVRITRNTFSINEDINPMRQRIIISPSGSWVAPWDPSITHMCDVTIIGAGGAGGSGGTSGDGNHYPGFGGQEGETTTFAEYTAAGGGGGAGGAHCGGGAGGGAGMVTRVRMPIQGHSVHAIHIGSGGLPGCNEHAIDYSQQKGGGVYGGRPMGTPESFDPDAIGTAEGGQGGAPGRASESNYAGWSQGFCGGCNGTGFGGGGGGGAFCYSNWGSDGGGRGYDGGENGSAIVASPIYEHNPGGKGGDGAIIVEWDLPLQ